MRCTDLVFPICQAKVSGAGVAVDASFWWKRLSYQEPIYISLVIRAPSQPNRQRPTHHPNDEWVDNWGSMPGIFQGILLNTISVIIS